MTNASLYIKQLISSLESKHKINTETAIRKQYITKTTITSFDSTKSTLQPRASVKQATHKYTPKIQTNHN